MKRVNLNDWLGRVVAGAVGASKGKFGIVQDAHAGGRLRAGAAPDFLRAVRLIYSPEHRKYFR